MSELPESATLYTRYTSKVDEDLMACEKELGELVARQAQVERDLELLRKMKAVISSNEGSPSQPGTGVLHEEGAERPGQAEAWASATAGPTDASGAGQDAPLAPAKKTTAKKAPAKKTTAKKAPAKKTTAKKGEPGLTRQQLILNYFAKVGQPRSSTEVTKELTQLHPGFTSSTAATREALEGLVSKGKLERTTQGRSVYYSPVPPTSEDAGDADGTPEVEAS
ncbi:hypothetical protein ACWC1D_00115 [Streptomyces sp. NPDC001478]